MRLLPPLLAAGALPPEALLLAPGCGADGAQAASSTSAATRIELRNTGSRPVRGGFSSIPPVVARRRRRASLARPRSKDSVSYVALACQEITGFAKRTP